MGNQRAGQQIAPAPVSVAQANAQPGEQGFSDTCVLRVTSKTGENARGQWTKWGIETPLGWYNTFQASLGGDAQSVAGTGQVVRIGWRQEQQGKTATSLKALPGEAAPLAPADPPPDPDAGMGDDRFAEPSGQPVDAPAPVPFDDLQHLLNYGVDSIDSRKDTASNRIWFWVRAVAPDGSIVSLATQDADLAGRISVSKKEAASKGASVGWTFGYINAANGTKLIQTAEVVPF